MAQRKYTFAQAQLDGSNRLIYEHNLNTEDVIPFLKDNTGRAFPITDIFSNGDVSDSGNNPSNIISIEFSDAIAGTWTLLLEYTGAAEVSSGRRAFELSENNTPSDDYRIIFGKVDTPSANMAFSTFFTWIMTKLSFLRVANNLSDLASAETGRTNLGVYSTSQVDTALAIKASLYQTGSGAVLGIANTAIFTPAANYHPSTKLYTDTYGGGRLTSGSVDVGDIGGGGFANFDVTFTTVGTTNYMVLGSIENEDANDVGSHIFWNIRQDTKSATGFRLCVRAAGAAEVQNIRFRFLLVRL